jgi:hypothetical protein
MQSERSKAKLLLSVVLADVHNSGHFPTVPPSRFDRWYGYPDAGVNRIYGLPVL